MLSLFLFIILGAQKAPKGFEFHTQLLPGETISGFIKRMDALNIRFGTNYETGAMQECHQAQGSSYGVYECYDVPGWIAYCPVLKKDGSITWKRYKGNNYFNDCVTTKAGETVRNMD